MRYYDLADDVEIPGRWHLGDIRCGGTDVSDSLWAGMPFEAPELLTADVTQLGTPLDFCLTSFAVPVARSAIGEAIQAIAGSHLQRLPLTIEMATSFEVLNSTLIVKCLDERRSQFTKWTKDDHRADLAGQYRMVTELKIRPDDVPRQAHFFRLEGWTVALIVSEAVKAAMEAAGCLGAKFVDVT